MRRALVCGSVIAAVVVTSVCSPASAQTAKPFCDARVAAEAAFQTGQKAPALEAIIAIRDVAPAELQDEFAIVVKKFRARGFGAFEDPKVAAAGETLDAYVAANCGFTPLDIVATDYAFSGIPAKLAPGTYTFTFENQAPREMHELVVVRFNPGVTTSVEELVALPQKRAEKQVTFVTATGAGPGEEATGLMVMEPGRYAAMCFVGERGKKHGKPHALLGMTTEWTVS